MKRIGIGLVALVAARVAFAAAPEWIFHEFKDTWNDPADGVEHYLNEVCGPSGLDGLQLLGVQKGHGSSYNVHVYCRPDKSAKARYRVTMPPAVRGTIDDVVRRYAYKPNVRIGPFFFGPDEKIDGFLLIEQIR